MQCFLQALPLELMQKEDNKQSKEIPNPVAGKHRLNMFWSQSYAKLNETLVPGVLTGQCQILI